MVMIASTENASVHHTENECVYPPFTSTINLDETDPRDVES